MFPKLTQTVLIRMETDLDELLKQESKKRRVSKASVIREILRQRFNLVPNTPESSQEAA